MLCAFLNLSLVTVMLLGGVHAEDRAHDLVLAQEPMPPSPGAPSRDLLRKPGSATLVGEPIEYWGAHIGLYNCSIQGNSIICHFVLTKKDDNVRTYPENFVTNTQPRLIDDFRIEHRHTHFSYLNGRGQQQPQITLDKGESAWFVLEFADGAEDIQNILILFGNSQIRGTMTH
jgi:hypothetical protein